QQQSDRDDPPAQQLFALRRRTANETEMERQLVAARQPPEADPSGSERLRQGGDEEAGRQAVPDEETHEGEATGYADAGPAEDAPQQEPRRTAADRPRQQVVGQVLRRQRRGRAEAFQDRRER